MHDTISNLERTHASFIDAALEETLRGLVISLRDAGVTAEGRRHRQCAITYFCSVLRWAAIPPTEEQRRTMIELVGALEAKLLHARTIPVPRHDHPTSRPPSPQSSRSE